MRVSGGEVLGYLYENVCGFFYERHRRTDVGADITPLCDARDFRDVKARLKKAVAEKEAAYAMMEQLNLHVNRERTLHLRRIKELKEFLRKAANTLESSGSLSEHWIGSIRECIDASRDP